MKRLYKVSIASGLDFECLGDEELGVVVGDHVLVRCERYTDYAEVIDIIGEPIEDVAAFEAQRAQENKGRHVEGQRMPVIERKGNETDLAVIEENKKMSFDAHNLMRERIRAHNLEMKLIHAHYSYDRRMIIFQFSADGRIDFRELLRDLSGLFKIRVELRQIGVRDEAAVLGGLGSCGRQFCCASFLPSFNSINVKMAKMQGLSLNPQNISGCCGRLKCCLQYEAEYYKEQLAEAKLKQTEDTTSPEESAELNALDEKENADARERNASGDNRRDAHRKQNQPQSGDNRERHQGHSQRSGEQKQNGQNPNGNAEHRSEGGNQQRNQKNQRQNGPHGGNDGQQRQGNGNSGRKDNNRRHGNPNQPNGNPNQPNGNPNQPNGNPNQRNNVLNKPKKRPLNEQDGQ